MYQSNAEAVKAILGTPGIDTQKLLEMKDKQGLTALRLAVYQDRVEALKIILKTPGIDKQELLEMQDEFGRTILHTAAYKGHTEAIKTILKTSGIDTQKLLEVQDGRGKTTLHKAAYEGHVEAIKAILKTPRIDKQKLLKIRDKQELLALNVAGYKGHIQAIKVMLETPGIDVQELLEIQHGPGKTLLQQAASEGQVEALKVILETPGIDKQKLFEMQSKFGKTALHWAAYKGHAEAIKVILKTPGIDKQKLFEIRDKQGVTALSWAVREDNVKEIKVLLQHQINIVGLRGNEKKAISFLKPEELQEILKIEFSDELGKANSTIRIERETLVLNAIYDYLKTYGTDISWKSPNAWAGSLNRISDKVNALMGEMQDIGGIAGGVIVQREIDKVIREIIPKPQDQLVDTEGYSREVNSVQQNAHIRLAEVVKENAETMQAIEEPLDEKMRHNVNLEYGKGTAQLKPYAYGGVFEEYYIDAMDKLLALRLQNGLKTSKKKISAIAAQIIKDSYRVADAVETLIVQFEESSAIMPFLVQSSEEPGMHHWVGIVLANNGVEFSITYLDSENGLIIDGLVNPLQELLPESFIAVRRIPLEQQRYNNCGPELVENFIYYLTSSRATQEAAIYVHSLLLENTLLDPVEYVLKISENNKLIGFLSNQVPLGVDRPMSGRALEAKLQQSKALQFNVPDLNVITNIMEPQQIRYQHTEKVSFSYSESSGKSITILHNQVHAQSSSANLLLIGLVANTLSSTVLAIGSNADTRSLIALSKADNIGTEELNLLHL
jgi:ankyrin repeat protein